MFFFLLVSKARWLSKSRIVLFIDGAALEQNGVIKQRCMACLFLTAYSPSLKLNYLSGLSCKSLKDQEGESNAVSQKGPININILHGDFYKHQNNLPRKKKKNTFST